jgi:beta-phosphoglucomutase
MEICGFIFDLDGVITDTAEYHYLAWKRLADEEKIPFSREDNEHLRGISRRESLAQMLGGRSYPEEKIQEMLERKNRYYLEYIKQITPRDLLPGAKEFLEETCSAGLKSALGSASKNAREVIERLGIGYLFDAIADGYSVVHPKPAPDLFLFAAKELDLAPKECVVFEDAAAGIQAAQLGGFHSVGLGPTERVGLADAVFPSLENVHLHSVLQQLGAHTPERIASHRH